MFSKFIALGVLGAIASTALAAPASAGHSGRMLAIDLTKGRITDNGINDGRVCLISRQLRFDPWTERFISMKTKRCF